MKILLVDDHHLLRSALAEQLSSQILCECFQAGNGHEAVELVGDQHIDLVILDVEMPVMNGRQAFLELKKINPNLKVIVLTYLAGVETLLYFVHHGANGFLRKDADPEQLLEAIMTVLEGGTYFTEDIRQALQGKLPDLNREANKLELTERQTQLLQWLQKGYTSKAIANEMGVTHKTIDTYRERLMDKLETQNTIELVAFAARNGLLRF